MRFMIEAISSPRPVRRFIVEHIFVNAYRQYGRCHRELRESGNSEILGQKSGKGSEIAVSEIDGNEICGNEIYRNHVPAFRAHKSPYNLDNKISNTKRNK